MEHHNPYQVNNCDLPFDDHWYLRFLKRGVHDGFENSMNSILFAQGGLSPAPLQTDQSVCFWPIVYS